MKALLSFIALFAIIAHVNAADPIDKLVKELSQNPLWQNGLSPKIDLPASADAKEVIDAYFKLTTDPKGKITDWEVYKEKKVLIPSGLEQDFVAVWCGTEFGGRIILIRYSSPELGWWTRAFDAKNYWTPEK